MPTTQSEELELAIQDTESEANSMLFLNQNVLQEYQNRQREVQQIYLPMSAYLPFTFVQQGVFLFHCFWLSLAEFLETCSRA